MSDSGKCLSSRFAFDLEEGRFNRAERRQSKSQAPIGTALLRRVKVGEHFGKSFPSTSVSISIAGDLGRHANATSVSLFRHILLFVGIFLFKGLGPGQDELLSSLHGGLLQGLTKYP